MPKSFEDNIIELEKTVRRLESGDCTLEEAVEIYSKGLLLSNECKKQLDSAKQKIEKLQVPDGTEE